ncbi:ATP-binding protein [Methanococcoides burtonii]|uniref:ATP-binding protein n=1 Tax=Methanococcoides burtonii TaxID=29291 RepID=UPI0000399660|nr:ATP-binding protein [Methanococcoides burtonii]
MCDFYINVILFNTLEQLDSSSTRKFGGTGIGLILVKKYLDMLDGTILVESEPGQGSRFTFTMKPEKSYEE